MDDTKLLLLADKFRRLRDRVDGLSVKQEEIQTIKGDQGPKGEQGDRGFDGAPGKDGDDGADGTDGQDGKDGVSVVNAEITFDGSLVIYLSDGREIDCGEVVKETGDTVIQTLKQGASVSGGGGVTSITSTDGSVVITTVGGVVDLSVKPAGANTQIQFNNSNAFGASANFTYTSGTNTLTTGNITGSALAMTIQTRAPTSLETPGEVLIQGRDAIKANTNGGSIRLKGGAKTGFGQPGQAILESSNGEYAVRVSNEAIYLFGAYSSNFTFANGSFDAVGSQTAPLVDAPNSFVAGLNSTATGNVSFQFLTDSQVVFEFGEPTFGSQELAFFGVVPVTQPTTATAAATFVANSGTTINSASTFDGYTLAKVVKALRNLGILA